MQRRPGTAFNSNDGRVCSSSTVHSSSCLRLQLVTHVVLCIQCCQSVLVVSVGGWWPPMHSLDAKVSLHLLQHLFHIIIDLLSALLCSGFCSLCALLCFLRLPLCLCTCCIRAFSSACSRLAAYLADCKHCSHAAREAE